MTAAVRQAVQAAEARLEAIRHDAVRMSVEAFTAEHVQWSGLAWEALRNASDRRAVARWTEDPRLLVAATALVADDDVHGFCSALEPLWRLAPARAATPLLLACALLLDHTPAELWLAIEAGPPLFILSRLYRELRVRAYNRGVVLYGPGTREDLRRPRWQPFLGTVVFHRGYALARRPDVLRAFVGLHELAHLATITRLPRDPLDGAPRAYFDWMLGNEALAVAIQQWVELEVLTRVPHPFLVGVFNTPPSQRGHQVPPREPAGLRRAAFAEQTEAIVVAMQSLIDMVIERRLPDESVLRTISSRLPTAQGFIRYALAEWPVLALGLRGELLRACTPSPAPDLPLDGPARYVAAALDLWDSASIPRPEERHTAVRRREWFLCAWRAAELHDVLYQVDPGAPEFAALAHLFDVAIHGAEADVPPPAQNDALSRLFAAVLPRVQQRWVPPRYLEVDPAWVFLDEGTDRALGPEH